MAADPFDSPEWRALDLHLDGAGLEAQREDPAARDDLVDGLHTIADLIARDGDLGVPLDHSPHGAFVLLVCPDGTVRVLPVGPVATDTRRAAFWFDHFATGIVAAPADVENVMGWAAGFADAVQSSTDDWAAQREAAEEERFRTHRWVCDDCGPSWRYKTERGLDQHRRKKHPAVA